MKNVYIWIGGIAATLSCIFVAGTVLSRSHHRPTSAAQRLEQVEETPALDVRKRLSVSVAALKPDASSQPQPAQLPVDDEGDSMTADEFAFRVERMFDKDQPPTREAMARDRSIRDAFSAPDLKGVTFESSECRANTCRVQLTFDNMDYDRDVLNRMLLNPETAFARGMGFLVPTREEQQDGRVSTTVFLYASPPSEAPVD